MGLYGEDLTQSEERIFKKLVRYLVTNNAVCAEFGCFNVSMQVWEDLRLKGFVLLETFADLHHVKIARLGYPMYEKKREAKELKERVSLLSVTSTETLLQWKDQYYSFDWTDKTDVGYRALMKVLRTR